MMTIGNVTGGNGNMRTEGFGGNLPMDAAGKNIRNQIANAQKKLQELSENENLTPEEKMEKRQEIQQEITDLNQQLRQHQIEQRREKQTKGTAMDEMLGGNQNTKTAKSGGGASGLSQTRMQAMISADSSMKQAQVQGSVATGMKGRAGVLESEIQMDQGRGASTEKKEAELAEVEQRAMDAEASQANILAEAGQTLEEAAREEQGSRTKESDQAESSGSRTEESGEAGSSGSRTEESDKAGSNGSKAESAKSEFSGGKTESAKASGMSDPVGYTSIDIRL